jgi:hypothetical protein
MDLDGCDGLGIDGFDGRRRTRQIAAQTDGLKIIQPSRKRPAAFAAVELSEEKKLRVRSGRAKIPLNNLDNAASFS